MQTPDWTAFRSGDGADPAGPCCLLESAFPTSDLPRNYIWTLGYLGVFTTPEDVEVSAQVKSYSREWLTQRAQELEAKRRQAAEAQRQLQELERQRQAERLALTENSDFKDVDGIERRIEAGPLAMARGLVQAAGQLVTGGVTDPSERMAICQTCPFMGDDKRCGKCGCFLPAKTRVAKATCPIGKW